MPAFLDIRTSQGTRSGAVSTVIAAPDYVAGIGLQIDNATNIRVDLEATIGVISIGSIPDDIVLLNSITVTIVRTTIANITNFALGVPVFTQTFGIPNITVLTPFTFSVSAADFNPPIADLGQITYALFVSSTTEVIPTIYNGAQNLIGMAAAS
jgi:hypothetical protein